MQKDATEGVDNEDFLTELGEAMKVGQGDFLTEIENFFHSVIHSGKSIGVDIACETLQAGLKKKGGPVASYSQAG